MAMNTPHTNACKDRASILNARFSSVSNYPIYPCAVLPSTGIMICITVENAASTFRD